MVPKGKIIKIYLSGTYSYLITFISGLVPQIYRTLLTIPKEMKDQDIRKLTRKITTTVPVSPFPNTEELAQWDGTVPEFNHMELQSRLLSFLPLGKCEFFFSFLCKSNYLIFGFTGKVQDILAGEVDEEEDQDSRNVGLKLNSWLEWQRSLQGPNEAYHSSDSNILVQVLQLGDRMTLNNPTLLTQTAGEYLVMATICHNSS